MSVREDGAGPNGEVGRRPRRRTARRRSNRGNRVTMVAGNLGATLSTGLSAEFELLVSALRESGETVVVHDIGVTAGGAVGTFKLAAAFQTVRRLPRYYLQLNRVTQVYLTISSSRYGFLRDFLMIWPARLFNRRVVAHLHGAGYRGFYEGEGKIVQWLIARTLASADTIIVLDEGLKEQFRFLADADHKLVVVPNGLPRDVSPRDPKLGPKHLNEVPAILYLSHLSVSKGYLDLVDACAILKEELHVPFKCHFCGSFLAYAAEGGAKSPEQLAAEFHDRVRQIGLTDIVQYHGVVRGATKQALYEQADVFVLPTYHPWEGQPVSIIEALATGTPVVSTRLGAIAKQVIDDFNGYLVATRSPQEIARAVLRILGSRQLHDRLSVNAMEHYEREFTREVHTRKLLSVLLD